MPRTMPASNPGLAVRQLLIAPVVCLLLVVGCSREGGSNQPDRPQAPRPSAPATSAEEPVASLVSPAACDAEPVSWRFESSARVIAVGDVHGDLPALLRALRASGVVDDGGKWTAGGAVLVQVGDLLDRGDDEIEVLQLLERLKGEAIAAGGRVVVLNGNHELMNAAGDFRYVSPGGWRDFEDTAIPAGLRSQLVEVPADKRGRIAAFLPGGPWARKLAGHPLVSIVGDSVFVHGGVLPEHIAHLDAFNRAVQCWLLGQGPAPGTILGGDESPVWTRAFGGDDVACEVVRRVTSKLGVKRMVVGHTPQLSGVSSACDGALWRIDVGMAAAYGGTAAALVISADGPRPVSSK